MSLTREGVGGGGERRQAGVRRAVTANFLSSIVVLGDKLHPSVYLTSSLKAEVTSAPSSAEVRLCDMENYQGLMISSDQISC